MPNRRLPIPARLRLGISLLAVVLVLAGCASIGAPDPTATPLPSPTPTATPIPTATPSPTPFVPPTVAVQDDDSIRPCLERNLTPELLISLSMDDTTLTKDIMRTCLETQIPGPLVSLIDPIIEDASECALDVSKTLSNDDLIILSGDNTTSKDAVVSRVANGIVDCLASKYHLDFLR
ncbi:MAG: hypothetical protein M9890_06090 [Thermomicrobiales bacterium]|nr:hypothetical protein [Thermomicrobiales bacterium]